MSTHRAPVRTGKQGAAGKQTSQAQGSNAAASHLDAAAEAQRLREFLRPTAENQNLLLEDVEVRITGSHRTVHAVVDLPGDTTDGVSLDQVAEASQALSEAMDSDPHDDGRPYTLEVSSPGVSRPLTEPRHWRRNIGRLIVVHPVQGDPVEGRLVDATDTHVVLRPLLPVKKGTKPKFGENQDLHYDKIRKGIVQVEFAHADAEETGGDNE